VAAHAEQTRDCAGRIPIPSINTMRLRKTTRCGMVRERACSSSTSRPGVRSSSLFILSIGIVNSIALPLAGVAESRRFSRRLLIARPKSSERQIRPTHPPDASGESGEVGVDSWKEIPIAESRYHDRRNHQRCEWEGSLPVGRHEHLRKESVCTHGGYGTRAERPIADLLLVTRGCQRLVQPRSRYSM
jgi:hypothetical protein